MKKEGWEIKKLGEVAIVSAGQAAPKIDSDFGLNGMPFIRAGHLESLLSGNSELSLPKVSLDKKEKYKLKLYAKNSILFAKSGMSASLDRVYKLQNDSYVVSHLAIVEVEPNVLISDFTKYFLIAFKPSTIIKDPSYPSISLSDINNIPIAVPPFPIQEQIVAELDTLSDIITKKRQQLAELDTLAQSTFYELFGDPVDYEKGWEVRRLEDVMKVSPQNGLYKHSSAYVNEGGCPILRIDAFYKGKVTNFSKLKRLECTDKELELYKLKEDDIVINRVNSIEHLGKCARIKGLLETTVFESNMMRFSIDNNIVNVGYLVYQLCTPFIFAQILSCAKKAVNQASINQQDVKSFRIPLPPIALQNQFAEQIEAIERQKELINQSIAEVQKLFDYTMDKYFN